MSTDDDFTAYVGTHWSALVRSALLLGSDGERAESVVADALVGSYQRWARVWQDDRADLEVLTRLLGGIYEPAGRRWRTDSAQPGMAPWPGPRESGAEEPDEPEEPDLAGIVRRLDPLHRDVLVLRYVAELEEPGIAEVLDVRPATVQQRIEQALAAVRPAGSEQQLVALVEEHRQEQPMSLPPAGLLALAHAERGRRRRRTTAISAGVLAGLVAVSGAVHVVRALGHDSPAAVLSMPAPPWARHPSNRATRMVGSHGWVIRVPAFWGTDLVACDGVTAARPTVIFADLLTPAGDCPTRPPSPYVLIGSESFRGVPWRTISGAPVLRRPHLCAVCAQLRVPSAGVSFQIHADNPIRLHQIERSLQPIGPRQVVVPTGPRASRGRAPLDVMVPVAIGAGLRPRVVQIPSRLRPGTFLRSDPPIGTPVDLGRSISLFFSAGDLGRFASPASLRRHGWRIFAVTTAQPAYRGPTAVRAALGRRSRGGDHPTFLRTLTITHEGPRRAVVRRRLVWLVVSPTRLGPRQGATSIAAVDAATGHVIEVQKAFRGRDTVAIP